MGQRHVRVDAQDQCLALGVEAAIKPPILPAVRHHLQMQPARVRELAETILRLGAANQAIREHLTVSPALTGADIVRSTGTSLRHGESLGDAMSAGNPGFPGIYGRYETG